MSFVPRRQALQQLLLQQRQQPLLHPKQQHLQDLQVGHQDRVDLSQGLWQEQEEHGQQVQEQEVVV